MRRYPLFAAGSAVLLAAAAIATGGGASAASGQSAGSARSGALVKVVSSRYGRVVADNRGEALYVFTKDGRGASRCYADCAKAWPPFLTRGVPRAGTGIAASGLGATSRPDGTRQVTYRGRPLYYYAGDKPGVILCQNVNEFGGDWLVVAPSGKPIR
jgi:predicted lipoprotein with Yx(FWY)xxD motif